MAISAVLSGLPQVREVLAQAQARFQAGRRTVLFVDEVHRFNKAQQDAFLPWVEQGLITFIGATTENPSFEVNSALLSRAAVYVLEPLGPDELAELFARAVVDWHMARRWALRACSASAPMPPGTRWRFAVTSSRFAGTRRSAASALLTG